MVGVRISVGHRGGGDLRGVDAKLLVGGRI